MERIYLVCYSASVNKGFRSAKSSKFSLHSSAGQEELVRWVMVVSCVIRLARNNLRLKL